MLTCTIKHALLKSHTHKTNKISGFSNGFEKKKIYVRKPKKRIIGLLLNRPKLS
jgi:hypothetical protein